jgi:hypothetical protein
MCLFWRFYRNFSFTILTILSVQLNILSVHHPFPELPHLPQLKYEIKHDLPPSPWQAQFYFLFINLGFRYLTWYLKPHNLCSFETALLHWLAYILKGDP